MTSSCLSVPCLMPCLVFFSLGRLNALIVPKVDSEPCFFVLLIELIAVEVGRGEALRLA